MVKHYIKATGKTRIQLMVEEEQVINCSMMKIEKWL